MCPAWPSSIPTSTSARSRASTSPRRRNDGRYLYAADSDLGVVGVIDTREDKVIKVIRVGKDPWRIYMSHDGKYGITAEQRRRDDLDHRH